MQNQNCYLLSYIKYGDNDAVLHCFSEEAGYQSFFVRGIYSPKNKKKPYFFPLNYIQISFQQKRRNANAFPNVYKIEQLEQQKPSDFQDVRINAVLFFASDFLNQILRGESENQIAFHEIKKFRNTVNTGNIDSYVGLLFRFLSILGINPLVGEGKFLNPETGNYTDDFLPQIFDQEISKLWRTYLIHDNPYEIVMDKKTRNLFVDSIMNYYKIHVSGFYIPNSLGVLRTVFE